MADYPLIDQASLLMVPSATKEGKLYSQLPTDGSGDFTFTRATSATRVNEEGYIEKGYENLLTYCRVIVLIHSPWFNALGFGGSITSGQTGYDGSSDAWLLERTSAFSYIQQTNSDSGVFCCSAYLKAGTYNWAYVRVQDSTGYRGVYFDLENGTTGIVNSGIIDYNIEAIGTDGWYRCSIAVNSTLIRVFVYLTESNGGESSSGTGNIYIQDAQLNQGLVAYPYLETTTTPVYGGLSTDQPRLDYTDASCPSVLIEPSRTNL